jgi:high-affinity iron transporter
MGYFNAVLGWQNSATYGSVISYNVYRIAVMGFLTMRYSKVRGHWPLIKPKKESSTPDSGSSEGVVVEREENKGGEEVVETVTASPTIEV